MKDSDFKLGVGHWPDSLNDDGTEYDNSERAWEDWRLVLHGYEAGDYLSEKEDIEKVLLNLGYRLIKIKTNTKPRTNEVN